MYLGLRELSRGPLHAKSFGLFHRSFKRRRLPLCLCGKTLPSFDTRDINGIEEGQKGKMKTGKNNSSQIPATRAARVRPVRHSSLSSANETHQNTPKQSKTQ
jgi:hypothetical protein